MGMSRVEQGKTQYRLGKSGRSGTSAAEDAAPGRHGRTGAGQKGCLRPNSARSPRHRVCLLKHQAEDGFREALEEEVAGARSCKRELAGGEAGAGVAAVSAELAELAVEAATTWVH